MRKIKFSLPMAAIVLGIGLAAVTSLSSFTKSKSGLVTARYYNTTGTIGDMTPSHFVYQDGLTDDCNSSTVSECSAQWTTTNAPVVGQPPTGSPSYVGNTTKGVYIAP